MQARIISITAAAKPEIAARAFLEHEREIFRSHAWCHIKHLKTKISRSSQFTYLAGILRCIDCRWIAFFVYDTRRTAKTFCNRRCQFLHPTRDRGPDFSGEPACRATDRHALRNDIPGVATMYLRHGNNGGFKR
ncbi:hypothetical protein D3C80_1614840 [compost metagenome]